MKCSVIQMRQDGIAVPKHTLKDQVYWEGNLAVMDVRDDGVNRVIKIARLNDQLYGNAGIKRFHEPHIVWMNEGRLTLQGFERVLKDGKIVEYAQSWLCQAQHHEAMT